MKGLLKTIFCFEELFENPQTACKDKAASINAHAKELNTEIERMKDHKNIEKMN